MAREVAGTEWAFGSSRRAGRLLHPIQLRNAQPGRSPHHRANAMRPYRPAVLGLLAGILLMPASVHAGAWTLARGHIWTKITFMYQSTNEEYAAVGGSGRPPDRATLYRAGDRARYRFDGEYDSRAAFLDIMYGLTDRADIGLQVPFFRQRFQDSAILTGFGEPRTATGFSDLRALLKLGVIQSPVVVSLKSALKAPTGDFRNEDGLIPVGEGQWDIDLILQAGRSFWPVRAYANIDVGYRIRLKNNKIDRDPGDEWFLLAEAGWQPLRDILISIKYETIRGRPATNFGIRTVQDVKRITYISPTLSISRLGNLSLESALRISVNGRSFPAGPMLVLGLSYTGHLPGS
jgi:hypothetical protein